MRGICISAIREYQISTDSQYSSIKKHKRNTRRHPMDFWPTTPCEPKQGNRYNQTTRLISCISKKIILCIERLHTHTCPIESAFRRRSSVRRSPPILMVQIVLPPGSEDPQKSANNDCCENRSFFSHRKIVLCVNERDRRVEEENYTPSG